MKPSYIYFLLLLILLSCGSPESNKSKEKFLVIHVRTDYSNASPEDMEHFFTKPLEKKLKDVPNLIRLKSISQNGVSIVKLIFPESTDKIKILHTIQERITELSQSHSFPTDLVSLPRVYPFDESFYSVLNIHYTNKKMYGLDFLGLVNEVQDELSKHPSIKEVKIHGVPESFILLEVDSTLLQKYDLTINEVSRALQRENLSVDLGQSQIMNLNGFLDVLAAGNRIKILDLEFYDSTLIGGILIKSEPTVFLKDLIAKITTHGEDENLQNLRLEIFKNKEYSEEEVQAVALTITKSKKNRDWYSCEIKKANSDFKLDKLTTEFPEVSNQKNIAIHFVLNRESCTKYGVSFAMLSNSISNLVLLYPEYDLNELLKFTITARTMDGIIQKIPLKELVEEIK
jgi:hypothetical protein